MSTARHSSLVFLVLATTAVPALADEIGSVLRRFCVDCHSGEAPEANLDLTGIPKDLADPAHFRRWVRVHDRLATGEMPPKDADQPTDEERIAATRSLQEALLAAEQLDGDNSRPLRRLTRAEYENTIRDLFHMPGIALAGNLPADGSAHGFDKHADALDVSHVNIAKYVEAADHVLDLAIATRPAPPVVRTRRISLVNRGGFVAHVVMNGDGVLLRDGRPDPDFPPAADQNHFDQGAHERWGSFRTGSTVGLFRHEDESFSPYFIEHVTIYPGRYRVRTSLWSFQWDRGEVLPGRGTEAARLSVVQLTGDGRGGQHPSSVLGYFDAPAEGPLEHELVVWLNHNELIGFNTASLAPVANYARKGRAMAFTGPGIAVDWLDVEGPLHDVWPPRSHTVLFGDLPIAEFVPAEHEGTTPPHRPRVRHLGAGRNRPDPEPGVWSVRGEAPIAAADRLLADFLLRLFRRPVPDELRRDYVGIVETRLAAGDAFETAMREAYRTALCSPDFLYHVEPDGPLDDHALACRLSYFLWNSLPDERLRELASTGRLRETAVLHGEVERLLADPRSDRFVEDFVDQWLDLRRIAANDPDRKLYPEFSPYLQDSMVAETRAYFRELLDRDLDVTHLVRSDFAMVNRKLAVHYEIPDVIGTRIRRVPLPEDCPRGGFPTQASILKVTANGTTTSPVPRGAFVLDRLLGEPPEPPPANVPAIEPDVRGATTIGEQLARHRDNPGCASCHQRIDPHGFALESFDVIGGYRERYRSLGEGDPAERGAIDPFVHIGFRLGPAVESRSELPDGRAFEDVRDYQRLMAADPDPLLRNLARRFAVYGTGREVRFADRPRIAAIVERTRSAGGGIRTLLHEVVASPLFHGGAEAIPRPERPSPTAERSLSPRMMMTVTPPPVANPIRIEPGEETAPERLAIDGTRTVTVRVEGFFEPERVAAFRNVIERMPEARIITVDFDRAEAALAFAPESRFLNGATDPGQVVPRLANRVREVSDHRFSLAPVDPFDRAKLVRVDLPIRGLDCDACSFGVYHLLLREEGVHRVTASFGDRLASAWIDPDATNEEKLVEALERRGVVLEP